MSDEGVDGTGQASAPAAAATRKTSERIGARLAAAREAAGLELVDIARETRVPVRHLRAIEADAHDELPALPYAVGFVKSLARAVGVDPDEAGARFRAETTMVPHAPMAASIEPLDERRLPSRGLVLASVVVLVLLLGGLTAYGAGWFDAAPPASVAAAPTTTVPDAATAGADAVPAGVTPATVTPAAVTPAVATGSGVSVVAKEDAWIRIYRIAPATGRPETVKTGVLAKGERYDVPADQPGLKLWTGRAGALQVIVGGQPLPPLGGPVETVRNVSLDAADLRARAATPAAAAQ